MSTKKTVGSLLVRLGMDPRDADRAIKNFEKNLKDAGRRMESIGRTMSIGFTAPFVLGMRQAIKAFDEEAQAVKKLEIALGGNTQALQSQAAMLQKTTIYADDQVLSIQAWAAALGHSESEVAKMTTAAVGLASAMGIELQDAMEMLHKSTLGQARGLGQLLPEVKAMTKAQLIHGDAVELVAQKFKGYAEAAAKTGSGPLKVFTNQVGDLSEQLGMAALPALTKIVEKLSKLAEWFSKLSPETKEWLVRLGGIVALSGPVLIMAGNVIKLAEAFWGLSKALGAVGRAGLMTAVFKGVQEGTNKLAKAQLADALKDYREGGSGLDYRAAHMNAAFIEAITGNFGKATGLAGAAFGGLPNRNPASSMADGGTNLLLGVGQSEGGGLPPMVAADPFAALLKPTGGTPSNNPVYTHDWDRLLQWMTPSLSPTRQGGIGPIAPGSGQQTLSAFGQAWGNAPVGGFQVPTEGMDAMSSSFEDLTERAQVFGDVFGSVMGSISSSLEEGGGSFAEYALKAVAAIGQVIRAKMMEAAVSALKPGAEKGGLVGLFAGIIGISIALGLISKVLSNVQKPAMARGGMSYGPASVMIGDNPSGKEAVLPFERTGEFAGMIAQHLGGAGGGEFAIRGDDLVAVTSRAQSRAIRRGSGNVIRF